MASRDGTLRPPAGGVLVAALALALTAIALAMAASAFGLFSGEARAPSTRYNGGQEVTAGTLPMPTTDDTATVLDPASVVNKMGAQEAIDLARASAGGLVGDSPIAQLVSITTRSPDSQLNGFERWVILSTDVPGFVGGPVTAPSIKVAATYTWVCVSLNGEVVAQTQVTYPTSESVPALP
jgi:hypothetical protein